MITDDTIKYIENPLDKFYLVTPGEFVKNGMLPPEEFEVRKALVEMKVFTERLLSFGFFGRIFNKDSYNKAYQIAHDKQSILKSLVNQSLEHRAALSRIVNAMPVNNGGREVLTDYLIYEPK